MPPQGAQLTRVARASLSELSGSLLTEPPGSVAPVACANVAADGASRRVKRKKSARPPRCHVPCDRIDLPFVAGAGVMPANGEGVTCAAVCPQDRGHPSLVG